MGPDEMVRTAEREARLDPGAAGDAAAAASRYLSVLEEARALLRQALPVLAQECTWCGGRGPASGRRLPAGQSRLLCPRCMAEPGLCNCCGRCGASRQDMPRLAARVRKLLEEA